MTIRASFVRAGAVALPLGLAATAAHAANLVDVAGGMEQLSTFNDAIAAAGLEEKLAGEGPFTVFAPSNQAFEQLPQPLLSKLLEEAHQAELTRLLEHHVIDGKTVSAKDVVGRETEVETAAGDQLTVDGTGSIVLVIPTGMTVARAGDQVMVERRAAVAVAPSVEVGAGEEAAESTEVAEDSDMPATEHQQEVLASDTEAETRQTAPEGEMPATQHQEEVLASDAETDTGQAAESEMPATQHQEEVLASQPETESGQAAPESGMPATQHQEEVLAEGDQAASGGDGSTLLRQGSVIAADIEADNGVIHVIDAVLVPQELRETLEQLKGDGGS